MEKTKGPRFLFVHLYEPYHSLGAREKMARRSLSGRRGKPIGCCPGCLMSSPRILILLTSDHGDRALWEEGEREHGPLLQRSVTRVPLLIRPPQGHSWSDSWNPLTPSLTVSSRSIPAQVMRPKELDPLLIWNRCLIIPKPNGSARHPCR